MRSTSLIRRIDDLGRVVIPREIRKKFGIGEGDPMEIFVNRDEIVLRKYDASVGLNELINRLSDEFSDVKNDMETNVANEMFEHIIALQSLLKI